jgi:hypothetical protein
MNYVTAAFRGAKRPARVVAFVSALGFTGTLLTTPLRAEDLKPVSCGSIELSFSGEVSETECMALDSFGNQTELKVQRLVVKSSSFILIATHYAAAFHSYLLQKSLRDTIELEGFFAHTDNWQTPKQSGGFEIVAFEGLGRGAPMPCAGFARYSGTPPANYEYPSGPGYKELDAGIYCATSGSSSLFNPIDNFYAVVEDALGKLHLPQ